MSCACNPENPQKEAALKLIDDIIHFARIEDKVLRGSMKKNGVIMAAGISPVEFHLKSLKELIEEI